MDFSVDSKSTRNKRSASCVQVEEVAADVGPSIKSSDSTAYGFSKEQHQHHMSLFQQADISPGIHSSPSDENIGYANLIGVTFSRLRKVKLIGDLATEPGIQLVKLLLAKSPVLVRMLIETWINDDNAEQLILSLSKTYGLDVVLAEFPRASPNVKVVYNVEYDHCLDYLL
ncbi:hypothetical protein A4A49_14217 [Nicotiana attenuata]|uniref:Uncharacterized protein n=1 Tax=Nicotiana attenuata TaxID=49451 RepID=A0A1J6HU36_NICAT|nr:hypothetical protein A4A49_14217 [Nicotiana attenuata]